MDEETTYLPEADSGASVFISVVGRRLMAASAMNARTWIPWTAIKTARREQRYGKINAKGVVTDMVLY
jgi:hypothetical protein